MIASRLVNTCWFFFKWAVVLVLLALTIGIPYFYHRIDDMVRREVERELQTQLAPFEVTVRSAELVEGEGVELRDVVVTDPTLPPEQAEIAHLREAFVGFDATWEELLDGKPQLRSLMVREPTIRVIRTADGVWHGESLLHKKDANKPDMPGLDMPITVHGGVVELVDEFGIYSRAGAQPIARKVRLSGIELKLDSPARTDQGRVIRRVDCTFGSQYFDRIGCTGSVDIENRFWTLDGQLDRLTITPELQSLLPDDLLDKLRLAGSVDALVDGRFHLHSDSAGPFGVRFDVSGRVEQGRVVLPQLEHPVVDLKCDFHVTDNRFEVKDFSATSGRTHMAFSSSGTDYFSGGPINIAVNVHELDLNRHFEELIPQDLRKTWWEFDPSGRMNLSARLHFDGRRWSVREVDAECLSVSFSFYRCPYRLDQCRGRITIDENQRQVIDLRAYSGSQLVSIRGELFDVMSGSYGGVDITAEELTIDEKMVKSLTPDNQKILRNMSPSGTIGFSGSFWRTAFGAPMHQHVVIDLKHCSGRYKHFPYPLDDVSGQLEMNDGQWKFRNLTARNGTAVGHGYGSLSSTPQGNLLTMKIFADDLPLEEELRDAFQMQSVRDLWNDLKLAGRVNLVTDISYLAGAAQPNITFTAAIQPEHSRIQPKSFPYLMDNVQGVLRYRDGQVTIDKFQARHGEVRLSSEVQCWFRPDWSWELAFNKMLIEQIRVDKDLLEAAPVALRTALEPLKLQGPVNVAGDISLLSTPVGTPNTPVGTPRASAGDRYTLARSSYMPTDTPYSPGRDDVLSTRWDLAITMHQAEAVVGLPIESVNGKVMIRGQHDGRNVRCRGTLDIDSLVYQDVQLTDLSGPFYIDDRFVWFGESVAQAMKQAGGANPGGSSPMPVTTLESGDAEQSIEAKLFDGRLRCDGWAGFELPNRFELRLRLDRADLALAARELMASQPGAARQDLQGKLYGTSLVKGRGTNLFFLQADGNMQLRQADIYEVPQMIQLLQSMSIREPDETAFSDVNINFRVRENRVLFDRLDLTGNAFSLEGTGEMDFEQNVNLTFGTRMGRRNTIPVVSSFLNMAGEQLVVMKVEGPLSNPRFSRQALPGVSSMLEQLPGGLRGTPPTAPLPFSPLPSPTLPSTARPPASAPSTPPTARPASRIRY